MSDIFVHQNPYYRTPRGMLRQLFIQEFPNADLDKFEKIVAKYKDEEVERVVDGAMRFGLAAMMDVIDWKEHKSRV